MSRRYPRIRARITATVSYQDGAQVFVCQTRDISERGCFLDAVELVTPGTQLHIALMDHERGMAIELEGEVARCLPPKQDGTGSGLGIRFPDPPSAWGELVAAQHLLHERERRARKRRRMRLRVLVVGDDARQRGAMALYVTSGWDVRFASDLDGATDALYGVRLDAIITESDVPNAPWHDVLSAARQIQPTARRVVRSRRPLSENFTTGAGGTSADEATAPKSAREQELYHAVIDLDAGLDALLDALIPDV